MGQESTRVTFSKTRATRGGQPFPSSPRVVEKNQRTERALHRGKKCFDSTTQHTQSAQSSRRVVRRLSSHTTMITSSSSCVIKEDADNTCCCIPLSSNVVVVKMSATTTTTAASIIQWASSSSSSFSSSGIILPETRRRRGLLVYLKHDIELKTGIMYLVLTSFKMSTFQNYHLCRKLEAPPISAKIEWIRPFDQSLQRLFQWGDAAWIDKEQLQEVLAIDDEETLLLFVKCFPTLFSPHYHSSIKLGCTTTTEHHPSSHHHQVNDDAQGTQQSIHPRQRRAQGQQQYLLHPSLIIPEGRIREGRVREADGRESRAKWRHLVHLQNLQAQEEEGVRRGVGVARETNLRGSSMMICHHHCRHSPWWFSS